jgi:hypothetical protein
MLGDLTMWRWEEGGPSRHDDDQHCVRKLRLGHIPEQRISLVTSVLDPSKLFGRHVHQRRGNVDIGPCMCEL